MVISYMGTKTQGKVVDLLKRRKRERKTRWDGTTRKQKTVICCDKLEPMLVISVD